MATWALGKPKELYLSSFKVLSRFVVQEVIQYTGPDPYLDAIIIRTTRNIGTIVVDHQAREDGVSGYTFRKLFALWSNMIVAFSVYPLRLIGLFGLVMLLIGAIYGGKTLLASLLPSITDPSDIDQLRASMWFFRGSTLVVISIIAEYIGRIHRHLTAAPQFIIRHQILSRELLQHSGVKPSSLSRFESSDAQNG
jgi:undecaprenyl-phosphate 4-deoxy-4-formamido-L-arabinose transferase